LATVAYWMPLPPLLLVTVLRLASGCLRLQKGCVAYHWNMSRKHSEFPYPESSDRSLATDVLLRQEPEEEEDEEDDDGPKDDNDDDEEGDGYSACLCFRGGLVLMGAVHMM
jgi:hypothetical protein